MAYKVFTNGSPLPASDLNTYLMNQSVMVFANSTARSAALTAPTEGMITYLEDTELVYVYKSGNWVDINDNSGAIPKSTVTTAGDLIVADGNASVTRLGIGSNGQILTSNGTTATWSTPAGGGGWDLLSTTSLSGTTVDVSGISQSYKNLRILVQDAQMGSNNWILLYLRNSTPAGITVWNTRNRAGTTWSTVSSAAMEPSQSIDANTSINLCMDVISYSSTTQRKPILMFGGFDDTSEMGKMMFGATAATDAVDGFRLVGGASFTAGQIQIYGGN